MARVALNNVLKTYPGEHGRSITAIRDLSVEISDREFVVFVGPSGCGKSTLLRLVAGLEQATSGDIFIGSKRVNGIPPRDRDLAMVFQNCALYPHLSVFENIAFGLNLKKLSGEEIRRRVNEAAGALGLGTLLDRKPQALSGGQRQRVALGRAIVRQPKAFLFDEPLSNLDPQLRSQLRAEIIGLHQRLQATMVYVTHDQAEAMTMGSRIAVMDAAVNPQTGLKEGVIQQVDAPLKIYNEPANLFVAGFLGSPRMNFLTGTVTGEKGELIFKEKKGGTIALPLAAREPAGALAGREMILGVRPEACTITPAGTTPSPTRFQALAEIVEPMGPETWLTVQTGAHSLVCRGEGSLDRGFAGHRVQFQIDASRAHLFDPATGIRLP